MKKRILKGLIFFTIFLAVLLIICIAPIDRTPLHEQPFYNAMMQSLDTMEFDQYPVKTKLQVGWSSANIMPSYTMPMAGYAPRDRYDSVHDSLYVRTLAIGNGSVITYLVSLDLLLFPPALTNRVNDKLGLASDTPIFVYYSATHTHSGIGGWDHSLVGEFSMGDYHKNWIEETSELIINQLKKATAEMQPASIGYLEEEANTFVYNRLDREAETDGSLRGLQIIREDSSRAILVSFSAHPTSIRRKSKIISGDYPTYLIKEIETKNDFGMFMAGMMGSHGLTKFDKKDFELIEHTGKELGEIVLKSKSALIDSVSITTKHIPIVLGPSQLRITKNFHVRDWIMRAAMRPLKGEITYLEIGDFILLGTSCDFSGEIYVNNNLDKLAAENGKKLMITSFNGNYTGYITADHHYDVLKKDEVRIMNWVGPYFGEYYTEIIEEILDARR